VTWKQKGIKHDAKHGQLRLSKGWNLKDRRLDFILAAYETCPDVQVENDDLSDIREDENGDSRNWGQSGNKKSHGGECDRLARLLEYKAEEHGILGDRVDEENTSKTCSCCGQIRDSNRVESPSQHDQARRSRDRVRTRSGSPSGSTLEYAAHLHRDQASRGQLMRVHCAATRYHRAV